MAEHAIKTHPITIHLNKSKGVTVTPGTLVVLHEGDGVEWRMAGDAGKPGLHFAVDFCPSNEKGNGRRSPMRWHREQEAATETAKGEIEINPDEIQTFRYAIAVWDGENLYALDPEIRIGPRH